MSAQLPIPAGTFSETERWQVWLQYSKNPADLSCPRCGPDTMEVLAFIEPAIEDGLATVVQPVGLYAAAIYCHGCQHGVGVIPQGVCS